jgi:hypothetical protein
MRRSCKWKWSYHWRDQQLHVAWHGWQICGLLTLSQLSFRNPKLNTHARARAHTHTHTHTHLINTKVIFCSSTKCFFCTPENYEYTIH